MMKKHISKIKMRKLLKIQQNNKKTINERKLHVVVGIGDNKLWLVTAYEPDPLQWDNSLRKRKE